MKKIVKSKTLCIVSICLLLFLGTESVQGSCLSYGHSCWGAHGKRSLSRPGTLRQNAETSPSSKLMLALGGYGVRNDDRASAEGGISSSAEMVESSRMDTLAKAIQSLLSESENYDEATRINGHFRNYDNA